MRRGMKIIGGILEERNGHFLLARFLFFFFSPSIVTGIIALAVIDPRLCPKLHLIPKKTRKELAHFSSLFF